MNISPWLGKVCMIICLILVTACGGGTSVAVDPGGSGLPQGDFALGISGTTWSMRVQFPAQIGRTGGSSIPFGTEMIHVEATSETSGIPYEATLSLTRSRPSGVLSSVPPQASIRLNVEALGEVISEPQTLRSEAGRLVLATASTVIPPQTRGPVVLRLTPASFLPVLQGIVPNPVSANGLIRLVGQNMNRVGQIIFTGRFGSPVSVVLLPGTDPSITPIQVPAEAVSGEVIALDSSGLGVGTVNLRIATAPTPTPTSTPSPDPDLMSLFIEGRVEQVSPTLASRFSPGQLFRAGYTFDPTTLPRSGSTSQQAVFDALVALAIDVEDDYEAFSVLAGEIQLDNNVGSPPADRYAVVIPNLTGDPVNGLPPSLFILRLDDPTGTTVSNALTFPTNPQDLSWDPKQFFLFFGDPALETKISGVITTLSPLLPTPTPSPGVPTITSCLPSSGTMASDIVITGRNLPGLGAVEVLFNGIPSQGYFLAGDTVTAEVPVVDQLETLNGPIILRNTLTGVEVSCTLPFTVTDFPPPPRIDSFTPMSGSPGEQVFLVGQFFRRTTGVFFVGASGDVPSTSFSFSNRNLEIGIPTGAVTGPITVVTQFGSTSMSADFMIEGTPSIP